MSHLDQTLPFALKGYAWLPDLRRRALGRPARIRFRGRPAVAVVGPDAARFFYTDGHLARPAGDGVVHSLDGLAHRDRTALLSEDGVSRLADLVDEQFEIAVWRWRGLPEIALFDETARVIAASAARWLGVPEIGGGLDALPTDLLAMVDGGATRGPRQARAGAARRRRERWLAEIIEDVRRTPEAHTPLATIARHSPDGRLPDAHVAAAEALDVLRSTTAVTWLVAFAAHALDRWPRLRGPLRDGDGDYARAFAREVLRFYPFVPFLAGRATRDLRFQRTDIPAGTLVLLDVYGQHHDERFWPEPYAFRPERFLGRPIGEFELIALGGGDPRTGHRCPGEQLTVELLSRLAGRLAALDYYLPPQRTGIDLSRIPTRPRDGIRLVVPAAAPVPAGRA